MVRRSFSLLLARRYLNPRRSTLSVFSLTSLIGVILGVMALVVVMAVMAGIEKQVKERLLGFTPHILLEHGGRGGGMEPVSDWREAAKPLASAPGVKSVAPFIVDNVIFDVGSSQKPVNYQGLDTEDKAQVDKIAEMLDTTKYPGSTADMGLDDRVVISSVIATQFKIKPGQKVRLYSTRNFDQVLDAYKRTEKPVVRDAYPQEWGRVKELLGGWKKRGEEETLKGPAVDEVFDVLGKIMQEKIRSAESSLLEKVLMGLNEGKLDEKTGIYACSEDQRKVVDDAVKELDETDLEKMDAEALKHLKQFVLPKEAEVVGVYQVSQMAVMPDVFMPLPLAQTLSGLEDSVQGISVRLNDAYQADRVVDDLRSRMGPGWDSETWTEKNATFFMLISQQRSMMYVAMSVIMLVAAFSMTAVMFTVTIQKRREIGVMKALGATSWQIVQVFLYQGMILGLFGAVLGIGFGRLFVEFRGTLQQAMRYFGFDPFSAAIIGSNLLPAENDWKEQMCFGIAAFVLCSVAALIPAFFAARSDAAKSLRNL